MAASATLDSPAATHVAVKAVRPRRREILLGLGVPYLIATLALGVLGSRLVMPLVTPDEFTYGHLAASLAQGNGFTWHGGSVPFRSALYIFLIVPSWVLSSGTGAYAIAKLINSAAMPLLAIPVYLYVRRDAGPKLASICAILALLGIWTTNAALLLTENLALPLAVATLFALASALRDPRSRWGWIAIGLAIVSAFARTQLIALLPVILIALAIDSGRRGRHWRKGWTEHRRVILVLSALILLAVLGAFVSKGTVLGSYAGITDQRPSTGHAASVTFRTAVGLAAACGFAPVAAALAAFVCRNAWRDAVVGPILITAVAGTLVLIPESGWFTAGQPAIWHIERYVTYLGPVLVTLAVLAVHRHVLTPLRLWIASAGLVGACLLLPPIRSALEERAYYVSAHRTQQLFGGSDQLALAVFAAVVGVAFCIGLAAAKRAQRGFAVVAATIIGLTLAVQWEASWSWQIATARGLRAQSPQDLAWLQHDVHGNVAEVMTRDVTPEAATTDFFSSNITRLYRTPDNVAGAGSLGAIGAIGGSCEWSSDQHGRLSFDAKCGPPPRRLYLNTPGLRLTIRGERVLVDKGPMARVVEIPPRHAQVLASIVLPCARSVPLVGPALKRILPPSSSVACSGSVSGLLYPNTPGALRVTYRGGTRGHYVATNTGTTYIPPSTIRTVKMSLSAGPQRFAIREDWANSAGAPTIVRADLDENGHSQRVL